MSTYVASSSAAFTTQAAAKSITIPAAATVGMFLLLHYSGTQTFPDSTPSGWTQLIAPVSGGTNFSAWYYRIAQAGDPGSVVTIAAATNAKTALTMTGYSGVDTTNPIAAVAARPETASSVTHADPAALSLPSGWSGKIVRVLSLKDAATASTSWSPSAGTVRVSKPTAGGSNQAVSVQASLTTDVSTYTAGSWTVDQASANAVTLALALRDATAAPPAAMGVRGVMSGGNSGGSVLSKQAVLVLPSSTQVGDTALVVAATNVGDTSIASAPAGWHQENHDLYQSNNNSYTFSKVLTAADINLGTVTITWNLTGRIVAAGIVLYGLDPLDPFGTAAYKVAKTATLASPSVVTAAANEPIVQIAVMRTATGAASTPTWPSDWSRQVVAATNFATTGVNMSVAIATLAAPGIAGTYGGETITFSGPSTSTDSSEQVYTVAGLPPGTASADTTKRLYKRQGAALTVVRLAKRSGATVVLL